MSPINQKIEDTFSGYKITGWMGMTERFKWGIETYFHTGLSMISKIMKIPSTKNQISNKSQ
jgi:hypothetical protein